MDFQEFKEELYLTILRREETADKCVRLTERELCVWWYVDNKKYDGCWSLELLYAEFLQSNLQKILDDVVGRLRVQYYLSKYPVVMRPLNYNRNKSELEDGVYWRFGDISLVLYTYLYESEDDCVMIRIERESIQRRQIAEHMLLQEVLHTTSLARPPRMYKGTDIKWSKEVESGMFMSEECSVCWEECFLDEAEGIRGYRVSTLGYLYGAVAIFYPGVLERLAEILEGDYYVGFINVHEAVVHPVRYKILEEMKAAIFRANLLGDSQEMLTNQVFRYCNNQKRLVEV